MIDIIKKSMKGMLVYTIIMLVIGIIFAVNPGTSINVMTGFIAILAMLLGGYFVFDYIKTPREQKLLSFSLAFGIVLIGIGLFIFLKRDALINFITVLIGITLIVKAIYKLQIALNIRKLTKGWKYNLLVALLTFTMGLILVIYPEGSAETFLRIIGIVIALGAIGELVETAYVMGTIKEDITPTVASDAKELPFEEK
jgi:uncharacterized membrane protein HdeD (DUF308 family)